MLLRGVPLHGCQRVVKSTPGPEGADPGAVSNSTLIHTLHDAGDFDVCLQVAGILQPEVMCDREDCNGALIYVGHAAWVALSLRRADAHS